MKKTIAIFSMALILMSAKTFAQTTFKQHTAGHVFTISLPDYMSKTLGLNDAATIQFKSDEKDVYGFIIEDSKEALKMVDINFASINAFYDDFIKDFAKDEEKRKVSKPVTKKVGANNFVEADLTYYDKEANVDIYYFVGIVETPTYFYKVLCWSTVANKDKFKADFQKTLYSLKD